MQRASKRIFVRFESGQMKQTEYSSDDAEPVGAGWEQVDLEDDEIETITTPFGVGFHPKPGVMAAINRLPHGHARIKPVEKKPKKGGNPNG